MGLWSHVYLRSDGYNANQFNYQPREEMMSYAKLFTHIGRGLDLYGEKLDGLDLREEPDTIKKSEVATYLNSCFDHFESACDSINTTTLYTTNHKYPAEEPWKDLSVFDIAMLAYNHTVHHRGQATTYLRLNGLTPPRFRF